MRLGKLANKRTKLQAVVCKVQAFEVYGRLNVLNALLVIALLRHAEINLDETMLRQKSTVADGWTPPNRVQQEF